MSPSRIHIAADHAGLELSAHLVSHLQGLGYQVVDHGPGDYDPNDDYPAFCFAAAEAVIHDEKAGMHSVGIVLGGSGNGEQIAANKVPGIRAALVWNEETARLAREHNNANVVALGGRQHTLDQAQTLIEAFLAVRFTADQRHVRRIEQISSYEKLAPLKSPAFGVWPKSDALSA